MRLMTPRISSAAKLRPSSVNRESVTFGQRIAHFDKARSRHVKTEAAAKPRISSASCVAASSTTLQATRIISWRLLVVPWLVFGLCAFLVMGFFFRMFGDILTHRRKLVSLDDRVQPVNAVLQRLQQLLHDVDLRINNLVNPV